MAVNYVVSKTATTPASAPAIGISSSDEVAINALVDTDIAYSADGTKRVIGVALPKANTGAGVTTLAVEGQDSQGQQDPGNVPTTASGDIEITTKNGGTDSTGYFGGQDGGIIRETTGNGGDGGDGSLLFPKSGGGNAKGKSTVTGKGGSSGPSVGNAGHGGPIVQTTGAGGAAHSGSTGLPGVSGWSSLTIGPGGAGAGNIAGANAGDCTRTGGPGGAGTASAPGGVGTSFHFTAGAPGTNNGGGLGLPGVIDFNKLAVTMSGSIVDVKYYVNAASGNDSNSGLSTAPFQTFQRAMEQVANEEYNVRVTIFIAGTFTLPSQYTFKNYRSNVQQDFGVGPLGTTFAKAQRGAINIVAEGVVIDTVASVTSTSTDAQSGIKTFTTTKNYTLDQMRGKYLIDASGNPAAISGNTAGPNSQITVCTSTLGTNLVAPFTIYDYGATVQSASAASTLFMSYGGCPITVCGVKITNTGSGNAVLATSSQELSFQCCSLKGVMEVNDTDSNSSATRTRTFLGCTVTKTFDVNASGNINNTFIDCLPTGVVRFAGNLRATDCIIGGALQIGGLSHSNIAFFSSNLLGNALTDILPSGDTLWQLNNCFCRGRINGGLQNIPQAGFLQIVTTGSRFDANGDDTVLRMYGAGYLQAVNSIFQGGTQFGINLGGGVSAEISGISGVNTGLTGLRIRDGVVCKSITGGVDNTISGATHDFLVGVAESGTWASFYAGTQVVVDAFGDGSRLVGDAPTAAKMVPAQDNNGKIGLPAQRIAQINSKIYNQTVGATLSSGTTITLTDHIHLVSGTGVISNIVAPAGAVSGAFYLIPTGAFTLTTGGNIGKATAAVLGQSIALVYDGSNFYPSY